MPTTLLPYWEPQVDYMDPVRGATGDAHYMTETSLEAITVKADRALRLLRPLMRELRDSVESNPAGAKFGHIARIECFFDVVSKKTGMALFGPDGELIIHVSPAILGRVGATQTLCWELMTQVAKVDSPMFYKLQSELRVRTNFMVVVSRQIDEERDGMFVVADTREVKDKWDWRIVR
jgi:hypothetical protein